MAFKQIALVFSLALAITFGVNAEVKYSLEGTGYIYEAVDGDTVWFSDVDPSNYQSLKRLSGDPDHFRDRYRSVKMRIFGINTAESDHVDPSRNTIEGKVASRFLASRINGKAASYHCWDIGKYDRPICSVQVDGFGDIGQQMIRAGFSRYVTKYGFHPYSHREYQQASGR